MRQIGDAISGSLLLGSPQAKFIQRTEMWPRSPLIVVILLAANVAATSYVTYRLVDPLPPRHLAIAAGAAGSGYDNLARQYARILARNGVDLEIRNFAGAVENLDRLRDPASEAIGALIAGEIDVVIIPQQDFDRVQQTLGAPGIRLMSVAQAEAIAKTVPGLKHVVLWRCLLNLSGDLPNSDVNLLALRNRVLVRKDLHPALQYLLMEALREVHWPAGPFNRLGEFPAEQPNDLPLSPTAQAFYRPGPTLWQRYTSFWLTSLLNRIAFFVIPVVLALIPVIGFALTFFRWLHIRRSERSTPRK